MCSSVRREHVSREVIELPRLDLGLPRPGIREDRGGLDFESLENPPEVEQIGHYDPKKNPADIKIDRARVDYWVSKGAQVSPTVKSILKKTKAQ